MAFRAPKPWTLKDKDETITSFYNWQSNIIYHVSVTNEFVPFLELEWEEQSTPNRGLADDGEPVPAADRKTAAQKNIILERLLGLIAQFVPPLLRNDVIKKSTSLAWIWTRVRKYYSFTQSEVNFMKLHTIQKVDGERYETLFQRIISHLEDNLLTVASEINHDGAPVEEDEVMSPTAERLAAFIWLQLVDKRLPAYVMRVYAHDLQSKSLKDLQPQLAENMDSLLSELNAQEDIQIHYSRSAHQQVATHNQQDHVNHNVNNSNFNNNGKQDMCAHVVQIHRYVYVSCVKVLADHTQATILVHAGSYPREIKYLFPKRYVLLWMMMK